MPFHFDSNVLQLISACSTYFRNACSSLSNSDLNCSKALFRFSNAYFCRSVLIDEISLVRPLEAYSACCCYFLGSFASFLPAFLGSGFVSSTTVLVYSYFLPGQSNMLQETPGHFLIIFLQLLASNVWPFCFKSISSLRLRCFLSFASSTLRDSYLLAT